ncbi:PP2C family protein-serine/threonine phosphatase [Streptomyces sp. NPDC005385]|uniref:PP2C family protein-serine/threonine phosphatase n=1 Tax=Streptomyces sp. NPDC005385 TaxID=3157039 RepID=UPI0033A8B7DE
MSSAPAYTAWAAVPYPVVVVDQAGVVRWVNPQADHLVAPRCGAPLRGNVPSWLADGHSRTEADGSRSSVSGLIGERFYEAHPTVQDDGDVAWWLVDDTDHQLARDALRLERERTAFLAQASNALLSSLNVERCMDVTAQLAAEHLADAALVIAPRTGRRLPVVLCRRGGRPERFAWAADPDEVPGLGEALQGFPPVPSRWIDPLSAPEWLVPEGFGPVGSIVITPLPGHGVPAGALVLLRRSGESAFTAEEEVFARLFAARAGAAMSAARLYAEQSTLAQTLMQDLLPPVLQKISGVEFAGGYRAARDQELIGGDFYDVYPAAVEGEETFAVLGDVCGKGLEAAVLTGKIRNTLQALLPLADDHQRVIDLLNSALVNARATRFATLVMASAVREGGTVRLRVTSAGHEPVLIVRSDGTVETGSSRGTLVGALPKASATTVRESLAQGDFCVLFTDGFTEARGGPLGDAMFGQERLKKALSQCAGMPAEAVVEHMMMIAADWAGPNPHDDMAVMIISAPSSAHLSAVGGHTRGRFTA